MDKAKDLGQVFTPASIVHQILDEVGYTSNNPAILDQKIFEPACGEGVFLYAIIDRLVAAAHRAGMDNTNTARLISENVWGVEYDEELFISTKSNLLAYCEQQYNLKPVLNLYQQDSLTFGHEDEFDYVVGNPPYIRVHNMPAPMRAAVKSHAHSTGTTDLYVIFIELGLKWLRAGGQLGYIAPNSWLRNTSQQKLRTAFIKGRQLRKVVDFGHRQIFDTAATYTALLFLAADPNPADTFRYEQDSDEQYAIDAPYARFEGTPQFTFSFAAPEGETFLTAVGARFTRLAQVATVQNGLATLGDRFFFLPPGHPSLIFIEPSALLPAIKASTYKGIDQGLQGIFPYTLTAGGAVPWAEAELDSRPGLRGYLENEREALAGRSLDSKALWFHYGRSQALKQVGLRKLVISPVVAPGQVSLRTYIVPADTLVYSGLFLTETDPAWPLERLQAALDTPDFYRYARLLGKDMQGGYKSINPRTILEYGLPAYA